MGISVTRSIAIQAIVTEDFKEELKAELQEAADEVQRRTDQMELQSRRYLAEVRSRAETRGLRHAAFRCFPQE